MHRPDFRHPFSGRPTAQPQLRLIPGYSIFTTRTGQVRTLDVNGPLDLDNPFFQDLGTNGRRCVTCHQPAAAWTITPANVQERFEASRGTDPIFTNNDGSNCEGAVLALTRSRNEPRTDFC